MMARKATILSSPRVFVFLFLECSFRMKKRTKIGRFFRLWHVFYRGGGGETAKVVIWCKHPILKKLKNQKEKNKIFKKLEKTKKVIIS